MKKNIKRALLCTIVLFSVFILTGCTKKAITADDFKEKMEDKNYTVKDVTSQFSSSDSMKKAYIAIKSDKSFQIEFFNLKDVDSAISMYNLNKQDFEDKKGNNSLNTNIDGKNYSKYVLVTNGKFQVVCRVEKTLLYLNVPSKYEKEVKEIIEYLGY